MPYVSPVVENDFKDRLNKCVDIIKNSSIKYQSFGIFGSYARNDYKASSDIDFCIIVPEKPERWMMGALREELEMLHADVVKCCKEEYLQENYFHAVFEAAKSLSEKVREKTGLQEDGSTLFNTVFSVNNPRLALNSLQTSTEKNLQNGLKEMLNGVTHMVRNVTAHELKVKWVVNEQDAIDILTTISFLHKQLDECFVVPQHIIS